MAFFGFGGDTAAPKVTVVTTMKDEGPYILDWVAHYRAMGATDIVVFTNDCSDSTDQILRNLNRLGEVHHRFSRVMRRGPHKSALMWAEHEPAVREADWILVVDVDEYLQINVGDGSFKALIDAHPGADAIALAWRIFGNAGIEHISDVPVPVEFTRAQPAVAPDGGHRFIKTLYRNDPARFNRMGVHRPFLQKDHAPIRWVTPDGTLLDDKQVAGALHISEGFGYEVAQLNHYALRSVDAFLNKQKRGRANHFKGTIDLSYWLKFDHNDVEEPTLANRFHKALAVRELLLRDPALARQHEKGLEWARKMAGRSRNQPRTKEFFARLAERTTELDKAA